MNGGEEEIKMAIETAFDLYDILVNEVAGNVYIFIFLAIALIAFFGAYMRMSNGVITLMLFAFMLMMSPFFPFLLPFTLILAAGFIGWQLYKFIKG